MGEIKVKMDKKLCERKLKK